jgi:putative ABC transport system permease protein
VEFGTESWLTVIDVVSNVVQHDVTRREIEPLVYLPHRQKTPPDMWLVARTDVAPASLVSVLRREVHALDAELPIWQGPYRLEDRVAELTWDTELYGAMFLIFAAIALLLASVGLHAVIAYSVSQRTQEIGVRMAIGATAQDIRRLVIKQGILPVGIGLTTGLTASFAVNRVLEAQLVGVSAADPLTLAVVSAVLILSAALGCWIPARRATRVDPVVALKAE